MTFFQTHIMIICITICIIITIAYIFLIKAVRLNGHSKAELKMYNAGDYVTNPDAIRDNFPIEVYYKKLHYWESTYIIIANSNTYISVCDGLYDITPDVEIYLTTNKKRLTSFQKKYNNY